MPTTIQFQEIPIGQRFEFRGRRSKKLALSMAEDEDHYGNIFLLKLSRQASEEFKWRAASGMSETGKHEAHRARLAESRNPGFPAAEVIRVQWLWRW